MHSPRAGLLLAALAAASASAGGAAGASTFGGGAARHLRGRSSAPVWPPAAQVYSDPAAPPPWMLAPRGWAPALARTAPAPLAPAAAVPADPFVINAAYHEELASGLAHQLYGT